MSEPERIVATLGVDRDHALVCFVLGLHAWYRVSRRLGELSRAS